MSAGWKPYLSKAEPTGFLFDEGLIGPVSTSRNTDDERHRAARTIASFTTDAGECAELLDMLGLTADDGKGQSLPRAEAQES